MHPLIPLAHGALGPYDELLPILVFVIFVVMIGIAWFTSRKSPASPPSGSSGDVSPATREPTTADHHRLD